MFRTGIIVILICVFNMQLTAIDFGNPPKKKAKVEYVNTNIQVGGGFMSSALYLSRNIKEDNDARGYGFCANYGGKNFTRVSVQYTQYTPINIEPTWYNIKANTIEINGELITRF